MAVFADLRAGTDRGPGVDHGALADVRADVDEARHQHHVLADVGAAADDRAGHHAGAELAERALVELAETRRDLVPERRRVGLDHFHVLGAEVQQHGLLQRSEEHTSELQSLMRISYAVFCLKKKTTITTT